MNSNKLTNIICLSITIPFGAAVIAGLIYSFTFLAMLLN
jgi:hypothetical protein